MSGFVMSLLQQSWNVGMIYGDGIYVTFFFFYFKTGQLY